MPTTEDRTMNFPDHTYPRCEAHGVALRSWKSLGHFEITSVILCMQETNSYSRACFLGFQLPTADHGQRSKRKNSEGEKRERCSRSFCDSVVGQLFSC